MEVLRAITKLFFFMFRPIVKESSNKMASSCQQAIITKLINKKLHLSSKEM